MTVDLSGSVALVTGASRGIGRATALALAEAGGKVALVARSEEALEAVATECRERGGEALVVAADLTDGTAVDRIVRETTAKLGPINLLLNNAGMGASGSVLTASWPQWKQMIDVNLSSVMRLTHRVLRSMQRADWGALVFIASVSGKQSYGQAAGYCATKHGVVGFAGSVFEDVRHLGIKVTTICPGWVNTDMVKDFGLPLDDCIQADDVAQTVLFALQLPATAVATEIILRPQNLPG